MHRAMAGQIAEAFAGDFQHAIERATLPAALLGSMIGADSSWPTLQAAWPQMTAPFLADVG